MIYDKLSNILRYKGLNPNLDLALEHIYANQSSLGAEVELKGRDVYAFGCNYDTVPESEAFFEAHAKYADIQIMTEGSEWVDVSDISVLNVDEAHPDRDFWAMSGKAEVRVTLEPGSFLLVLPGDAHKLKIMMGKPQNVNKAVYKVRMKD